MVLYWSSLISSQSSTVVLSTPCDPTLSPKKKKKKKFPTTSRTIKNDSSLNFVDYPEFLSAKRIKFLNDPPPPPNPTPAFNLVICSLNADKIRRKSVCWWRKSQQFHQICCAMQIGFSFDRGCSLAILCHFAGWKRRRVPSIVPEILKEVSIDHL